MEGTQQGRDVGELILGWAFWLMAGCPAICPQVHPSGGVVLFVLSSLMSYGASLVPIDRH